VTPGTPVNVSVPVPLPGSSPPFAFAFALALLLPSLAAAVPPGESEREAHPLAVHASAAKGRVKLGEPFEYTVEIRHRPAEWYALRPGAALAPFSAGAARCRRDAQAKEAVTTCVLPLSLFALGDADVPPLTFDVEAAEGKAVLRLPGPRISAVPVVDPDAPPEALRLRDLAPPVPLWVRSLAVLWWGLTAVAAVVALVGAALGMRAWRRPGARGPPPATPAERFARQLEALQAEELVARGAASEHLARLAELVRAYLAALAGVPALELTSAELLLALRPAADARLDLSGLEVFLDEADRVKFARQPAAPEACAAGMAYARGLLARTRPATDAEPDGAGRRRR